MILRVRHRVERIDNDRRHEQRRDRRGEQACDRGLQRRHQEQEDTVAAQEISIADRAAATGVGPRLEDRPEGRFVSAAINGLIGDKLLSERPQLAIPMAIRHDGRDVVPDAAGLAAAFPSATGRLVVFLHGLCESETAWTVGRAERGTSYPEELEALGWTPLLLRANTGLPLRENGVALTALLRETVAGWPVPVERIALVGHSMGGLIIRAAAAVAAEPQAGHPAWTDLVTDVVTLGTPHLGAPLATGVGHGIDGEGLRHGGEFLARRFGLSGRTPEVRSRLLG